MHTRILFFRECFVRLPHNQVGLLIYIICKTKHTKKEEKRKKSYEKKRGENNDLPVHLTDPTPSNRRNGKGVPAAEMDPPPPTHTQTHTHICQLGDPERCGLLGCTMSSASRPPAKMALQVCVYVNLYLFLKT